MVPGREKSVLSTSSQTRLSSLDGFRAISISLVLFAHVSRTHGFPHIETARYLGDLGNLGVRTFFVISGFLITHLLLREWRDSQKLSLRNFYARRALRIFPAFLAFMAVIVAAERFGLIQLRPFDITTALTYTVNFHYDRSWYVGHLWSLSVEEQFYLAWPLVLAVTGPKRSVWVAATVVAIAPICRLISLRFLHDYPIGKVETFPTVADALAVGCLLALLESPLRWHMARRNLNSPILCLLLVSVILACNVARVYTIGAVLGEALMNGCIALLILICVNAPQTTTLFRLLNAKTLVYIGTVSYSLYLWQQVFLNRTSAASICAFPYNLALTVLVANASYFVIEKPFLRLRHLFRRAATSKPCTSRQDAPQRAAAAL
jgi:peptidoglycan/LPS O-acetylase OafA/YrhL